MYGGASNDDNDDDAWRPWMRQHRYHNVRSALDLIVWGRPQRKKLLRDTWQATKYEKRIAHGSFGGY